MASSSSSAQEFVEYQRERSAASPKSFDAFISHRGPDVKDTLATELYQLLKARECRAFLDRDEIEGGDSIPFAIRNGICSSVVQIAIFSRGYAMSSWCLNELVLMLEQTDALFIPVFYDVEPWELRYIENEKSAYAAAFSGYQSKGRNLDRLDEWKKALISASYFSGYQFSQHKDNLCEKIVSRVLQEMKKRIPLHVAKYAVGLAELVQDFENCCSETARDKITIVGIFGLGGSGKTTLAKELFNRKRSWYNASCFLSDVRESHANRDLHSLQSQLFKDLFNENRVFRNVDEGIGALQYRLGRATNWQFLIVLDDIAHRDQLDALLPEDTLSAGSLVIITTRDQGVLTGAGITIRYRMNEMDRDHAKELFSRHAFGRRDPPIAYEELVESFVEFCGGLPLSLKVLGAHVYGRDEYYWELELEKVRKIRPKDIMQRLKISFDGLDSQEKQIFIDIACFFNKKIIAMDIKSIAISIWNASGWSAEHAVQTLQDKCLIEVKVPFQLTWALTSSSNLLNFEMHDHLRDLGRQIADELGPPRLWKPEQLRSMEANGLKQILTKTKGRCLHSLQISSLKIRITYFIGSLDGSAETELLWLDIDNEGGKLKSIPSWIPLRKLHCLTVERMEELWSTFQQQLQINTQASFELRLLRILHSPAVQNLPDLIGKFIYLEELHISLEKTDITYLVQSLEQLSNLRVLQLWGSGVSLTGNLNLSKGIDSTKFEPPTSSRMNSLEAIKLHNFDNISKLLIGGEICPRLRSLEVDSMSILKEIDLKQLQRLSTLILWGCDQLETVSGLSSLTGLQVLCTKACKGLRSLQTLAHLRRLARIKIGSCHQLQSIEGLEKLQGLKSLVIEVPDNGDASVWNCIYGLRSLPSEYTILTGKPVDTALSRLNENLFSEVIGSQAVTEIERCSSLNLKSSSSTITIYALFVTLYGAHIKGLETVVTPGHVFQNGEWIVTVVLTAHYSNVHMSGVTMNIQKGFMATVDKVEGGKASTVLQRIADRLYGKSM